MRKILLFVVLVTILTLTAIAEFKDMPNNWSMDAVQASIDNGLLKGYDGFIYPDKPLTRAEMATIIARAFGATEGADISAFGDTKKDKWYYDEMSIAVKMGALKGDGDKLRPEDNITREEAFTVIARIMSLSSNDTEALSRFTDNKSISPWATEYLAALSEKDYIRGNAGKLEPNKSITRAEFAQLMFNTFKHYITDKVPESLDGNVIIKNAVNLKNITINGDVIIAESVQKGITFDNVTVNGRLIFRSGNGTRLDGTYKAVIIVNDGIKVSASSKTHITLQSVMGNNSSLTFDMTPTYTKPGDNTSTPEDPESDDTTPEKPNDTPVVENDGGKWSQWYD